MFQLFKTLWTAVRLQSIAYCLRFVLLCFALAGCPTTAGFAAEPPSDVLLIPPTFSTKGTDANYQKFRKAVKLSFGADNQSQFGLWAFLVFDRAQNGRNHTNAIVDKAIKEHPDLAVLHYYLARDAQDTLDDDRAIEELTKAIKCHPKFFTAYNARENLYRQSGQADAGLRDLAAMMALHPAKKAMYAGESAKFYLHLKKYPEAYKDAHLFLTVAPADVPTRMIAIEALIKMGDWKNALKEIQESEKYGFNHLRDLHKAQILIKLNRSGEALQLLNRRIEAEDSAQRTVHNPFELSSLLQMRAQLYKQLGKPALAEADLKRLKRDYYDQGLFMNK